MNESESNEDKGASSENKLDIAVSLTLDKIPVEVFLYICSFLDAKFLLCNVRLVCKRFNWILSDDCVWKCRIVKLFPDARLPALDDALGNENISWQDVSYHVDSELDTWTNKSSKMTKIVWSEAHISTVDTVKLINDGAICLSGGRDRTIAVWDIAGGTQNPLTSNKSAHSGWIWDLAAHRHDLFYSASWDSSAKLWSLSSSLLEVATFRVSASALSLACCEGLVAVGLFSPHVMMFDPRTSESTGKYSSHKLAIMALELCDNFLISASEDKTISVWDLRAGALYKSDILVSNKHSFPMCMSYRNGLLYVGDNKGFMHLVDTRHGRFEVLECFNVGHKPNHKLSAVWHNLGCIVTASTDKTVRIHTPTSPPVLVTEIQTESGQATSVDYMGSVLAIGCTENAIEVWRPTENQSVTLT